MHTKTYITDAINHTVEALRVEMSKDQSLWPNEQPPEPFHTGATHIDFLYEIKQMIELKTLLSNVDNPPDYIKAVDGVIIRQIRACRFKNNNSVDLNHLHDPIINDLLSRHNALIMITDPKEHFESKFNTPRTEIMKSILNEMLDIVRRNMTPANTDRYTMLQSLYTELLELKAFFYIINSVLITYISEQIPEV